LTMSTEEVSYKQIILEAAKAKMEEIIKKYQDELDGLPSRKTWLESQIGELRSTPIEAMFSGGTNKASEPNFTPKPIGLNDQMTDRVLTVLENAGGFGVKAVDIKARIFEAGVKGEDGKAPSIGSSLTYLKQKDRIVGVMFDNANTKTFWYLPSSIEGDGTTKRVKEQFLPVNENIKDLHHYKFT
jgi:vacuolar-type H+-ATPase subunit E/Vma4